MRHQDKEPWSFPPHHCFDDPPRTWVHWINFLKWVGGAIILVLVSVQVVYAEAIAETGTGSNRLTLTTDSCPLGGMENENNAWKAILLIDRELTVGCWGFYKYDDNQVLVHIPDLPKLYLLDLKDFRPLNLEK